MQLSIRQEGNIISIFMAERRFQAFLEMLILVNNYNPDNNGVKRRGIAVFSSANENTRNINAPA
jgi:hypothetical protein